ncbi:YihY/virulence factor BrkB family protein [uncultured Dokdonia sp.]|uniref:YihY/virulence factor BrkB family protein n=1 Tax=uncultured Dokdonia sp. TaxID=575653 RepID=UPI002624C7F8|nr:YihY/virulence factor BrkB family protein [uncultured Dokdonia sp.]
MASLENKLERFAIFRFCVHCLKKVVLPGFKGMTSYHLIKTYLTGIIRGTLSARAGSIAYSFFMAIFPTLLFLLNLIPLIPIDGFQTKFMDFIYELIPKQSLTFFEPVFNDISENPRTGLLSFGAILALILMSNGINAIFSGFEGSFNVDINRNFIRQYSVALGVAIVLALLLVTTITVLIYFEYVLRMLRYQDMMSDGTDVTLVSIGSYVFFVIMIYIAVATLYYFGTKEGRTSKFFSPGALMTTLLFMLTTYLFGIYIDNFSNYNELYGSIGALLIMMLYIWLNSNLLLLGFELNAALQKLKMNQTLNK